jgi:hypothetical protein
MDSRMEQENLAAACGGQKEVSRFNINFYTFQH